MTVESNTTEDADYDLQYELTDPSNAALVEYVRAAERERCAKLAEHWIAEFGTCSSTGEAIAAKIREKT